MYESFFRMEHTPFVRDIPAEKLYELSQLRNSMSLMHSGKRSAGSAM